ncbi:hypothetical protein BDV59DRAFT_44637 [Aspergillus ambiguus]|uniref:uncharacterized protein n=1 Tax=Aspergillus ambiguus TaxID=176160 RepID=UPI003CCD3362
MLVICTISRPTRIQRESVAGKGEERRQEARGVARGESSVRNKTKGTTGRTSEIEMHAGDKGILPGGDNMKAQVTKGMEYDKRPNPVLINSTDHHPCKSSPKNEGESITSQKKRRNRRRRETSVVQATSLATSMTQPPQERNTIQFDCFIRKIQEELFAKCLPRYKGGKWTRINPIEWHTHKRPMAGNVMKVEREESNGKTEGRSRLKENHRNQGKRGDKENRQTGEQGSDLAESAHM